MKEELELKEISTMNDNELNNQIYILRNELNKQQQEFSNQRKKIEYDIEQQNISFSENFEKHDKILKKQFIEQVHQIKNLSKEIQEERIQFKNKISDLMVSLEKANNELIVMKAEFDAQKNIVEKINEDSVGPKSFLISEIEELRKINDTITDENNTILLKLKDEHIQQIDTIKHDMKVEYDSNMDRLRCDHIHAINAVKDMADRESVNVNQQVRKTKNE